MASQVAWCAFLITLQVSLVFSQNQSPDDIESHKGIPPGNHIPPDGSHSTTPIWKFFAVLGSFIIFIFIPICIVISWPGYMLNRNPVEQVSEAHQSGTSKEEKNSLQNTKDPQKQCKPAEQTYRKEPGCSDMLDGRAKEQQPGISKEEKNSLQSTKDPKTQCKPAEQTCRKEPGCSDMVDGRAKEQQLGISKEEKNSLQNTRESQTQCIPAVETCGMEPECILSSDRVDGRAEAQQPGTAKEETNSLQNTREPQTECNPTVQIRGKEPGYIISSNKEERIEGAQESGTSNIEKYPLENRQGIESQKPIRKSKVGQKMRVAFFRLLISLLD